MSNQFDIAIECLRAQDVEFGTPGNAPAIRVLEAAGKVDKDRALICTTWIPAKTLGFMELHDLLSALPGGGK